jgi:hypothetical protein
MLELIRLRLASCSLAHAARLSPLLSYLLAHSHTHTAHIHSLSRSHSAHTIVLLQHAARDCLSRLQPPSICYLLPLSSASRAVPPPKSGANDLHRSTAAGHPHCHSACNRASRRLCYDSLSCHIHVSHAVANAPYINRMHALFPLKSLPPGQGGLQTPKAFSESPRSSASTTAGNVLSTNA